MIQNGYGTKHWYKEGKLHREDGPAVEYANGEKHWYKEGKHHRVDGPAVECANGNKRWYKEGELHREDGPAVEYADGRKEYWKNGRTWTDEELCKMGLFRGSCKRCSKTFISKIDHNNDTR